MEKKCNPKGLFFKTIAMLCVIVMVFCFAPMNVFAQEIRQNLVEKNQTKEEERVILQEEKEDDYQTKDILMEETQKRKANEKHYLLEDGTSVATIFPSNVHYMKNGELVDVDNTLEEKEDTKENLKLSQEELKQEIQEEALPENKIDMTQSKQNLIDAYANNQKTKVYQNKANSYQTKFSNKTKGYNLGSITSDGHTITWRLKNAKSAVASIKNPVANANVSGKKVKDIQINQTTSQIEYKGILSNVDVNYVIAPEEVKENIVLANKQAANTQKLVFEYETNGLEMKLLKDNSILVYQDKEENAKFTIKAPIMYDSKLEFSDKIEMKVEKKNKKYQVTILPNKEWLNEEQRVYPVIVDPTIQTSQYVESINDTYIYSGDTNNTGRYQAHILRVGNGSGKSMRSLIKFALPTDLKSGDQVIAAELSICNYPDTTEWNPPTDERVLDVHRINKEWVSSSANWSNTNSNYDSKVTDYIKYKYDSNNPIKENRFDITSLVKDWYTTGNNYGVMIKEHVEKSITTGSDAYFFASDTSGTYTNCRPRIIIAYRNQTGLENYLSYHKQSAGRAGQIYTNDYNGNLTLVHTDTSTPGNRLPVTIEHVYNTNEKDTDIGYGKGMRLNLSQTLELVTLSSKEYLKYIDEDATAHYFLKNATTNLYEDEDGLGLTVQIATDATMKDKAGNTMTFAKYPSGNKWHLKEIKDTNNNKITITLSNNNGEYLITQVEDAAGDKIVLTYASGKLQKITDSATRATNYSYDSSGRLITITYPDSISSNYTYGSKNELTKVQNIDGSYITYTYYTGQVYRVKNITEFGKNAAQGNSLTITYGQNLTKVTDNKGYSNTYTFDNYGHCISIADFGKEAENINNAYGKAYSYGTSGNINNKLTLDGNLISVKDLPNNLLQNPNFDNGLTGWTKNGDCTDEEKVVALNGNNVLKMVGDSTKKKDFVQSIAVSGKKGDVFSLYAWAKSIGVPNNQDIYKSARITVYFWKTDGTIQSIDIPVTSGTDGWQFIARQIVANSDYNRMEVYLIYYGNANEIYFDNVGLYKEEFGQSYQYDTNGNIISTQDLAKQNSTFNYAGNNNLLQNINPKGGSFTYEYDYQNKNRLLNATDNKGTKYEFEYDTYGNATNVKATEGKMTDNLENETTYFVQSAYSNKYFDIRGGSTQDGGVLQQWTISTGSINQQFKFSKIPNEDYYKIIPMHIQTKALYYNEQNENQVEQKTYENNDKFKWKLTKNTNETYRIENKAKPNYVISLKNNQLTNEGIFHLQEWNGNLNQQIYLCNITKKEECLNKNFLEGGEVYYIKSKTTNLYIEQGSDEEYSMIVQKKFKENNPKQLWRFEKEGDNIYRIASLGTQKGYVLYPKGDINAEEQYIGIETYKNTTAQKWRLSKNENGTYNVSTMVAGTTRYLRTLNDSKEEDTKIILSTKNDEYYLEKANMLETLEEGATYTLKAAVSNLYLGANGTNVEQQNYNNVNTQKWKLHKEANGYYSFRVASDTTKTMDLVNGTTANGTNIQIKTANGNDSEKFEIVPTGNNSYMLKPKNGKGTTCIDISGGSSAAGANAQNYMTNWTASQYFYFTKVDSPSTNKYIENKASYTSNGKYTSKIEDQLGNQINYEYKDNTGTLTSQTDAKGNKVQYDYDNLDRLKTVSYTEAGTIYQNTYNYNNDQLNKITHNGFDYVLEYDTYGNQSAVKVGSQLLITNEYEANNGNLSKSTYGNGQTMNYTYDRFNRLIKKTGNTGYFQYSYDGRGNIKTITNSSNNHVTSYTYDMASRPVKEENNNGYTAQYEYDKNSNVSKITDTLAGSGKATIYNYDVNNNINSIKLENNTLLINNYDRLLRIANKELKTTDKTYRTELSYTDIAGSNKTTTQIKSIKNGNNEPFNYTYDKNGNIETIKKGAELKNKYYYDGLNQLTREDDKDRNLTITYTYDQGGNIVNKKEHAYTTEGTLPAETKTINYTYANNWKDQLTAYDNKAITYDAIGNPLTYDGNSYTWQNGRQLASIQNTGLNTSYQYNDNGIRTQKTVNGVVTNYYLRGDKVVYEKTGDNTICYSYDEAGSLIGLKYNNTQYYYQKNIQGDIIGLLDNNLEEVVKYSYDSWGKLTKVTDKNEAAITDQNHIAYINPYLYREYRYDKETKLYYLQSRYYNPEWGRFINADGLVSTGQGLLAHNMYAYCNNNPVNMQDPTGKWFEGIKQTISAILTVYKTCIFVVSNIFLTVTNKPIAKDLFNTAMNTTNKEKNISQKTKDKIISATKSSPQLKKEIDSAIKKSKGNNFTNSNTSIEYASGDLYYGIQHANVNLSGIKKDNYWQITVKMSDTFDFNQWRDINGFGDIANNLGLVMQITGMLTSYQWDVQYEINY